MSNKNQTGRGFNGKGYYIALILCAAAIGISGYLYYRNANKPVSNQDNDPSANVAVNNTGGDNVPAIATQPSGSGTTSPSGKDPTATERKTLKTGLPVNGETVAGYAMDCLSYNETTRDWRVHNGVDIAAETGTPVLAAADGVVYTVYDDDTMGTTVVIRHEEGYTTKYACLDQDVSVSAGDSVTLGQEIGCVGTSALLESALGPHVHFSVTCNDASMNPAEFLNMD